MFGLKIYKDTKTKKFANDKERKKYFAIKNYYAKNQTQTKTSKVKKKK